MKNNVYKITIDKWSEHNPNHKYAKTHFLVSKRIFNDEAIAKCRAVEFQLFMYFLSVCADMNDSQFIITAQMLPRYMRISDQMLSKCLIRLQSFQVLTSEELKTASESLNSDSEVTARAPSKQQNKKSTSGAKKLTAEDTAQNVLIWEAYSRVFKIRYGVDPLRNVTVNAQINSLRKSVGSSEAIELVVFYLKHNGSLYLKKTHSFGLCLSDCETLRTQMKRGVAITDTKVRAFEKHNQTQETFDQIEAEWKHDLV